MVEIRRPNGRKPFKSKSGFCSSLPKIVIGAFVVFFLGTTFSTLVQTTTPNAESTIDKRGLDGRLADSRGNLRPKQHPPSRGNVIPNPKPARFQEDHEADPDHDLDPADNIPKHHEEEESPEVVTSKYHEKDNNKNSNDPDEEAPEMPDEGHHEDHGEHAAPVVAVKVQQPKQPPIPGAAKFESATSRTGTGPTKTAYVKDFDHERAYPAFRTMKVEDSSSSLHAEIAKMVDESSVTPCLSATTDTADPKCADTDTPLIVYNSASFDRTYCGTHLPPLTAVKLADDCDRSTPSTTHLFSMDIPPVSGQGMAPIIIKSHDDVTVDPKDLEDVECNIPCQQEKGMDGMTRVIDGTHWSLIQTMDDSYNYQHAKMERTNFRHDKYYSTQNWLSDVPLSNWDFSKYSMRRPAVDWDTALNKGVYMVNSACASQATKRQKYFAATSVKMKVDAMGTCHHNAEPPAGMSMATMEGRVDILKQYRMVLAFDATGENDNISEIIWEAYMSGAVPVVLGAGNLLSDHHLPPHSAIIGGEFSSWDEMAVHVKQVAENKTLWESYHTWRQDEEWIAAFEQKYRFTKTNPTCRICRWAYAKKFGLGWDHGQQEVVEPTLPRQLCSSTNDNQGLVSKPFEEGWIHRSHEQETAELIHHQHGDGGSACTSVTTTVEGIITTDNYKVHRTIHQHDSVTDMIITGVETDDHDGQIILRLEFPGVKNAEGAYFRNPHTLTPTKRGAFASSATMQDESHKVTILADWVTTISSPQEGVMEIVVQDKGDAAMPEGASKRIRVITEGFDVIHAKMTEFFPSSFATVMTKDFIDPLELFYADNS